VAVVVLSTTVEDVTNTLLRDVVDAVVVVGCVCELVDPLRSVVAVEVETKLLTLAECVDVVWKTELKVLLVAKVEDTPTESLAPIEKKPFQLCEVQNTPKVFSPPLASKTGTPSES
jgi:hypothetical protein